MSTVKGSMIHKHTVIYMSATARFSIELKQIFGVTMHITCEFCNLNPFQPSVVFHIETGLLICTATLGFMLVKLGIFVHFDKWRDLKMTKKKYKQVAIMNTGE